MCLQCLNNITSGEIGVALGWGNEINSYVELLF
jgi:hypothetical protein